MASTSDFLLIFGECATLMFQVEDSLKFAFFGPVTMVAGLFDISWDPHIFFNILYSKQSLH